MLKELYIKNYALIDEMTVRFSRELTVLSGETGAGKSIIVGALGLVLGEKAKTSLIRAGMDTCTVEGRFSVPGSHPSADMIERMGIEAENGGREVDIVIRRVITASGTSKSYINGLQVTVRDLQNVTGLLIDIHGQHEHQSLLQVRNHLSLLDRYGKLHNDLALYAESYGRLQELRKTLRESIIDERERTRRIEILRYSADEIARVNPAEGEEKDLEEEYKVLRHYEELVGAVRDSCEWLQQDESSAYALLARSVERLGRVREFSSEIDGVLAELEEAAVTVNDGARSLMNFVESVEYEPGRIDAIQSRIEQIKNLKKKYGDTIEEVLGYREKCIQELEGLETHDQRIRELEEKIEEERRNACRLALALSAQRRVAAQTLMEGVMTELRFLSLDKSRFQVGISYRENPEGEIEIDSKRYELSSTGMDHVEFMITTNPGEPLRQLRNVASGGELSRIMLAIKTVLGQADPILTFVFDEIDAGIGGRVAWAVGERLKGISLFKQILCITHQAQIASKGKMNVRVSKESVARENSEERTVARVAELNGPDRVEEIARMISGKKISEAALKQAREMIGEK